MEVVLLERIEKLGQMGDVVRVKNGYARNFLLPRKKALRATKANLERFETDRAQLEATNLERKAEAESVGTKIDGESFVILRQAGEAGQLYGSVTTRDIAGSVTEGGMTVTRNQIVLDTPIKSVGLHEVRIALHPEVSITVTVNVARTEDEAERQARGEAVGAEAERLAEEEEALAAEEVFEDEDLAQQAVDELEAAEETEDAGEGADDAGAEEDAGTDDAGDAADAGEADADDENRS